MSNQYWVVGAMWNASDDKLPDFIAGGYWYLGYAREDNPQQNRKRDLMRPGDRLAVKKMLGQGASEIEIRALGIIKHVDDEDKYTRVYVNWVVERLARRVPANGCMASVHGPYDLSDPWTRNVFCL